MTRGCDARRRIAFRRSLGPAHRVFSFVRHSTGRGNGRFTDIDERLDVVCGGAYVCGTALRSDSHILRTVGVAQSVEIGDMHVLYSEQHPLLFDGVRAVQFRTGGVCVWRRRAATGERDLAHSHTDIHQLNRHVGQPHTRAVPRQSIGTGSRGTRGSDGSAGST